MDHHPPVAALTGLPSVPSQCILSLLPLHQLIVTLPRVHPSFAPIAASVLRRNRRLVLHLGDEAALIAMQKAACPLTLPLAGTRYLVPEPSDSGAPLYSDTTHLSEHYRLRLAGPRPFTSRTVEHLTRRMPSIVHLEVIIAYGSRALLFPPLTRLLTHWAPTLRTLTLRIGTFLSPAAWTASLYSSLLARQLPSFHLLVDTLNHTLTSLETLTLAVPNLCVAPWDEAAVTPLAALPLPVLSRLREFNFSVGRYHPEVVPFLLEALEKYAGAQLTFIGIPGLGSGPGEFARLARSRFACRFTQVGVPSSPCPDTILLWRTFPNLTAFSLQFPFNSFSPHPFVRLLRDLSHLANLTFLTFWFLPVDLLLPVPPTHAPVLPLAPVKVLQLHFCTREGPDTKKGHDRLEGPSWGTLFPSVQIVKINPTGRFCGTCYPGQEANPFRCGGANYAQGTVACLTQLLAPLKALPSCRKIFYKPEGQFGHMAEFTRAGAFVRTHENTK